MICYDIESNIENKKDINSWKYGVNRYIRPELFRGLSFPVVYKNNGYIPVSQIQSGVSSMEDIKIINEDTVEISHGCFIIKNSENWGINMVMPKETCYYIMAENDIEVIEPSFQHGVYLNTMKRNNGLVVIDKIWQFAPDTTSMDSSDTTWIEDYDESVYLFNIAPAYDPVSKITTWTVNTPGDNIFTKSETPAILYNKNGYNVYGFSSFPINTIIDPMPLGSIVDNLMGTVHIPESESLTSDIEYTYSPLLRYIPKNAVTKTCDQGLEDNSVYEEGSFILIDTDERELLS